VRFTLVNGTMRWSGARARGAAQEDRTLAGLLFDRPWRRIASVASGRAAFPEGVYRTEESAAFLRRTGLSAADADSYAGVHTMRFRDGGLVDTIEPSNGTPPCRGSYTSTATTLSIHFEINCEGAFTARWRITGRLLRLSQFTPSDELTRAVFGAKPYRRIG
jgi:hypothetical protein